MRDRDAGEDAAGARPDVKNDGRACRQPGKRPNDGKTRSCKPGAIATTVLTVQARRERSKPAGREDYVKNPLTAGRPWEESQITGIPLSSIVPLSSNLGSGNTCGAWAESMLRYLRFYLVDHSSHRFARQSGCALCTIIKTFVEQAMVAVCTERVMERKTGNRIYMPSKCFVRLECDSSNEDELPIRSTNAPNLFLIGHPLQKVCRASLAYLNKGTCRPGQSPDKPGLTCLPLNAGRYSSGPPLDDHAIIRQHTSGGLLASALDRAITPCPVY